MSSEPLPFLLHNRYLLRQRLGVGGMGAVYLAEDRNLANKLVAVKENHETQPAMQAQFNHEAILLANLRHPALPAVTDHFIEADGRQFLVMEYIAGQDLREILQQQGAPLPEATVLAWMATVMDALDYLHSRTNPIVHRDIKPANIKRSTDGQIYLVDFGLAKMSESDVTLAGARGISPGYSPVEQYSGGTTIRSDIYGLGATLYVLLTNHVPLEAVTRLSGVPLTPPRRLNPAITRNTEQVILRAMALRPEDRFPTIAEMRRALYAKAAPLTQRVSVDENATTNYSLAPHLPQRQRRGYAWFIVTLMIVIGLAIATYATDRALAIDAIHWLDTFFRAAPTTTTTPLESTPTPSAPTEVTPHPISPTRIERIISTVFYTVSTLFIRIQPWMVENGLWILPLIFAIAFGISVREIIGTTMIQTWGLSLRHHRIVFLFLFIVTFQIALSSTTSGRALYSYVLHHSITLWLMAGLANPWLWATMLAGILTVIVSYRVIARTTDKSNVKVLSKITRVLSTKLITRPLQYTTQTIKDGFTATLTWFKSASSLEIDLKEIEIDVIETIDLKHLTNLIKNRQNARILLTGYGSFGGTVLVTKATREATKSDPWLVINFSIIEDLGKRVNEEGSANFEIRIKSLTLGILSTHITNNPGQEKFLKKHAKLLKHASDPESGRFVYYIPLANEVIDSGFFKMPMRNNRNIDINKFLSDLDTAMTEGRQTQYLQQAIVQLTGTKSMPTRVIYVFDKVDHLETLRSLSKFFKNERITVMVVARKEEVDHWKNYDQAIKDMKFYEHYILCKWRNESKNYLMEVIQRRLPHKEIPVSDPGKENFDKLCKHVCYIGKGISGEIHGEIDSRPEYYATAEGHIKLEMLPHLDEINGNAQVQDILDLNWECITTGVFKRQNNKTREKEDRARIGIYYLLDWIMLQKDFDFTHNELLSILAHPPESIRLTISDHLSLIDKIVESLLWVLIQHNYLEEKNNQYYQSGVEILPPRVVPSPTLKSLGLVEYAQNLSNKASFKPVNKEKNRETYDENVKNILFISANPKGGQAIPRREEKVIEDLGQKQSLVPIQIKRSIFSARVSDISRALKMQYHIIHISGHSSLGNLVVEDQEGNPVPLSPAGFATLFSKHKSIECVVLSVCNSVGQGKLIAQHIPYTIAMDKTISVDATLAFTREFYSAISEGKEYRTAFEQSCTYIRLHDLLSSEADRPQFIPKIGNET